MSCQNKVQSERNIFWAFALPISSISTNVLILPLLSLYWTAEHLSIWIVFITLIGLAQMVEAALHPNTMRNCKYILNGEGKVFKEGYGAEKSYVNCNETSFHKAVTFLYRKYAFILWLFVAPFGGATIALSVKSASLFELLFAWVLVALPILLSMLISYGTAYTMANDNITTVNKITVISRVIFCVLTVIGLYFGAGIQAISFIYGMTILSAKIGINYVAPLKHIGTSTVTAFRIRAVAAALDYNTKKLVINNVFSFVIQRGSILLATFVLGATEAVSYNLSVSVIVALSAVSQSWMSYNVPRLVQLRLKHNYTEIRDLIMRILIFSALIYFILCILLLLLVKFGSTTNLDNFKLVSPELLIFMIAVYGLELIHSIAAIFITTANKVPFMYSTIITGISALALGGVLSKYMGLWGVVLGLGVSQLAYNNWKWPLEMYKELKSWKV